MSLSLNLTGLDGDVPPVAPARREQGGAAKEANGAVAKKRKRTGLPARLAPDLGSEFSDGLEKRKATVEAAAAREMPPAKPSPPRASAPVMKRPRFEHGGAAVMNGPVPTTAQMQSVMDLNDLSAQTETEDKTRLFDTDASFESLGLSSTIVHHLTERLELKMPSKIQSAVLAQLISSHHSANLPDLLVRSETGSGKTLAYLLPMAHGLLQRPKRVSREDGTIAMIIVPTHELVVQVADVAARLFRPWHWLVVGQLMGGEKKKSEKARLRKGVTVLVATPGRLLDHLRSTKTFELRKCEWLVLDESDRLMDMGFESTLKEIINTMNTLRETLEDPRYAPRRTNIMLSATVAEDVLRLAEFSLDDPQRITVDDTSPADVSSTDGIQFAAPAKLRQHCLVVEQKHRLVALISLLRLRSEADKSMKAVVFFSTCDSVDFHHALFARAKLPRELKKDQAEGAPDETFCPLQIYRVHGNMDQRERTKSFQTFRSKEQPGILFSTDAAARGLDLPHLRLSVQYDPPTRDEKVEYLHRAGRTARMGSGGDALLFLLPSELQYREDLMKGNTGIELKELAGDAVIATLMLRGRDIDDVVARRKAVRHVTHILQECIEETIYDHEETGTLKELSESGFRAYCRAYATHSKEAKQFFNVRGLHLGHVARSFGLREAPGARQSTARPAKPPKVFKKSRHSRDDAASRGKQAKVEFQARAARGPVSAATHMRRLSSLAQSEFAS